MSTANRRVLILAWMAIVVAIASVIISITLGIRSAMVEPAPTPPVSINPGPPPGASDDELKGMVDPTCLAEHPNDWKIYCAE
jgi:hypothetical protein